MKKQKKINKRIIIKSVKTRTGFCMETNDRKAFAKKNLTSLKIKKNNRNKVQKNIQKNKNKA